MGEDLGKVGAGKSMIGIYFIETLFSIEIFFKELRLAWATKLSPIFFKVPFLTKVSLKEFFFFIKYRNKEILFYYCDRYCT